ncbi:MAG: hypothetical protein ACKO0M_18510 [Cyanobium sp.]
MTARHPLAGARPAAVLSLLFCSTTLVCCALPALLVLVGAGSVLATLLSWFPGLVVLSEQKAVVFGSAALALFAAGLALWQGTRLPCPVDPSEARRCRRRLRQARWLYAISCSAFAVGSFAAFVLPRLNWH